jgi:hypothetical protein
MSIGKKRVPGIGEMYFAACDICEAELTPEISWAAAHESQKALGWHTRRKGDNWLNVCPDCQSEGENVDGD